MARSSRGSGERLSSREVRRTNVVCVRSTTYLCSSQKKRHCPALYRKGYRFWRAILLYLRSRFSHCCGHCLDYCLFHYVI